VIGKLTILLSLLSVVTWMSGLALFALNANMTTWSWMFENLHIAAAIVVGSWLWIGLLSLLALALSAWVRWKVIAGFMMLVFFIAGDFFSLLVRGFFRSDWGELADANELVMIITARIFGITPPDGPPFFACVAALALMAGACLFLLNRRIRAYQVVS
jgi:ABC-2 type transport system permease protein